MIAEAGYRDLYDGIAWLASRNHNTPVEIEVLGKPMTINPATWVNDHRIQAKVGLASGDDVDVQANMAGLWAIHQQLKQQGSLLTDSEKEFNILEEIVQSQGSKDVDRFFNNPGVEEQILLPQLEQAMAMNEQLMATIEQMQNNPLVQPEMIKAETALLKEQNKNHVDLAKMAQDQQQFESKQIADLRSQLLDLEQKYTELELQHNTDIEGKGADDS